MENFEDTQQKHYNPALARDIIQRRDEAFDELPLDDVVLFLAHPQNARTFRSLARQTNRSIHSIERSVEYVREHLEATFPQYSEIRGESESEQSPFTHDKSVRDTERF